MGDDFDHSNTVAQFLLTLFASSDLMTSVYFSDCTDIFCLAATYAVA